ncbi:MULTISPECIES: L,D-transpeptidase [Corynebacterium]|uniref:L,D-transpeptidase n=1 Tax=Corynebacterium TaxID=1716 RepID=UPI0008A117B7|nr:MULTISPECIES: L,D-transpeptidase [Corynebacterium]MCX2163533.1 L,D-transpeptidase [Corynebacterium auriscanis]OFT87814.1 hypothetical protein HMPREF3098_09295 [Corynebacterium sp. HMSC28B08]
MTSNNPPSLRRRATAAGVAMLTALSLGAGTASAAPAGPLGSATPDHKAVLDARDNLYNQTNNLPPQLRGPVRQGIDNTANFIAPGALKAREAERARAAAKKRAEAAAAKKRAAAAAAKKRAAARQANNPCPPSARACVDLKNQVTWLQRNGKRTYGPVRISSGKRGEETPRGSMVVTRKVKDEISREFGNAPMPYSVYFTNNGHAFHEGDPYVMSNGCIHLYHKDAVQYFASLNVGDQVFIF